MPSAPPRPGLPGGLLTTPETPEDVPDINETVPEVNETVPEMAQEAESEVAEETTDSETATDGNFPIPAFPTMTPRDSEEGGLPSLPFP